MAPPGDSTASEYRPLRPAPPPATRTRHDLDHSATRPRRSRKKLINAACDACRRRKTKCDGERPACDQCRARGSECAFETVDTAQTRSQATKLRAERLAAELGDATRILNHLKLASDEQVAHVLARLRANEPPSLIAASLDPGPEGCVSSQSSCAAEGFREAVSGT